MKTTIKQTLQENMMNHMHSYNIGQVCNWLLAKQDHIGYEVLEYSKHKTQIDIIRDLTINA